MHKKRKLKLNKRGKEIYTTKYCTREKKKKKAKQQKEIKACLYGAIPSTTRLVLTNQPSKRQSHIKLEEKHRRRHGFGVLEESLGLKKLHSINNGQTRLLLRPLPLQSKSLR